MACKYCMENPHLLMKIDSRIGCFEQEPISNKVDVYCSSQGVMTMIDNNAASIVHSVNINYCPMCGRKLEED